MNIFKSAYWSLLSLALPAQVFAIVPCQSTVEIVGCRTILITTCGNSIVSQCESTIYTCGAEPCLAKVRGINCKRYGQQLDGLRFCNEVHSPWDHPLFKPELPELPGLDEPSTDFDFDHDLDN